MNGTCRQEPLTQGMITGLEQARGMPGFTVVGGPTIGGGPLEAIAGVAGAMTAGVVAHICTGNDNVAITAMVGGALITYKLTGDAAKKFWDAAYGGNYNGEKVGWEDWQGRHATTSDRPHMGYMGGESGKSRKSRVRRRRRSGSRTKRRSGSRTKRRTKRR
jgi:hypothetical protein